jgi:hypothetical protein
VARVGPGNGRRGDGWLRLGALVLLVGALYANTFGNALVWDDRLTAAVPHDLGAILTQRTGAFYRPLVMLSFALDHALWGTSPAGYHLTNVACHVAVAWLLGALASALGLGAGAALASALVFAALPVQTEAVTYVSGRTDILAALFALAGLLAWRRARTATDRCALGSAAAMGAALLCKEAVVALPLVLLVPGAHPAARPPRPILPIAVAALWLVLWVSSGGTAVQMGGLAARLPAIGIVAATYLRLLVWPSDLHLERFVAVQGWPTTTVLATWGLVAAVGAALLWTARRLAGGWVLLALAAATYAPVSGIVPVYPAIADRALFAAEHFLYLPLLGLVPLVVGGVASVWPPRPVWVAPAVTAVVLAAFGAVVVDRNRDWRDEETLFRHTISYTPPTTRVYFNLGNLLLADGRLDEAERIYGETLARDHHDAQAHLNLGIVFERRGQIGQAEGEYRYAIANDPKLKEAYRALARLLAQRGKLEDARRVLEQGGFPAR